MSALLAVAGVALLGLVPVRSARAEVTVHVDISNAPPATRIVFQSEPHVVYVPEDRVYVVNDPVVRDYDCFHYGPYWYAFSDGYWYRAHGWRGPFVAVHPRYVPTAIYRVPPGHWRHHAVWVPPGQAKKYAQYDKHDQYDKHEKSEKHDKHDKHADRDDLHAHVYGR
jgi:hypothetical protein